MIEIRLTEFEQPYVEVPVWRHEEVQGEKIDRIGLPIHPDLFSNSLPFKIDMAPKGEVPQTLGELTPTEVPIFTVSTRHGRSFDVGKANAPLGIWNDTYGHYYSSLSVKGANATSLRIIESATAPSGYLPYGLQEDDALLRVLRSSRLMREAGIPSEWIVDILEPQSYPINGKLLGQAALKKELIESVMKNPELLQKAPHIAEAVGKMAFFVTVRATGVSDRIWDLSERLEFLSPTQIRRTLMRTFGVYNARFSSDQAAEKLNVDNPDDTNRYFTEILPSAIGKNYARMHAMGLAHRFPHFGNITTLGDIVDLDSVHGTPLDLGDTPVGFKDIQEDFNYIQHQFGEPYKGTLEVAYRAKMVASKQAHLEAELQFIRSYMEHTDLPLFDLQWAQLLSGSPTVRSVDINERYEPTIDLLRSYLLKSFPAEILEPVTEHLNLMLDRYNELWNNEMDMCVFDEADNLIEEEMGEGYTLDEIIPTVDDLLAQAALKAAQKAREGVYANVLSHVQEDFKEYFEKYHSEVEFEHQLWQALASSLVDPEDVRLQTSTFFDSKLTQEGISRYRECLQAQEDITNINELTGDHTADEAGIINARRFYWLCGMDETSFMRAVGDLPATKYAVHELLTTDSLPQNESWAWLEPLCFITQAEDGALTRRPEINPETQYRRLLPLLDNPETYIASCTRADENGVHHVIIWRRPTTPAPEHTPDTPQ